VARSALERVGPLLGRCLHIGGQPVPIWALLAFGSAFVAAISIVAILALEPSDSPPETQRGDASGATTDSRDAELHALLARASRGDATALAQVTARPEATRGAAEWRALGRGHAALSQFAASIRAYEKALALDSSLPRDPSVLADLRKAAGDPSSSAAALALASKLSQPGADLIYAVWEANRRDRTKADVTKLAKGYLESDALRAHASPALLIALDLHKAQGCQQYKKLLPRAVEHADTRSLPQLKSLSATRGCGFLGLRDCYGCLRGNKDFAVALANAQQRTAPALQAPDAG
jgi:hypothetical protein